MLAPSMVSIGCANVEASPATLMPMQHPVRAFTCFVLFVSPSITISPSAMLKPAYCWSAGEGAEPSAAKSTSVEVTTR